MNRLRQLIQSNQGAGLGLRCEVVDNVASVFLFDVIDKYWGASAESLSKTFAEHKDKAINLHINSPGGDVFEARAMKAVIAAHPHPVKAMIEGVCASAATSVANACASVSMTSDSLYMIHEAWTFAIGNKGDLKKTLALLEKVDSQIVDEYVDRSGMKADQIVTAMQAETWYTADEAKEAGFSDETVTASQHGKAWDLSAYDKAPKQQPKKEKEPDYKAMTETARNRLRLFEIL